MGKIIFFTVICFFYFQSGASKNVVYEFHIKEGTQDGPWNLPSEMIETKMGDIVRIYNDDFVDHQLHTFGAPCSHGPAISPGESWDCVIAKGHNAKTEGAVYDHIYGPGASFWLSAIQ